MNLEETIAAQLPHTLEETNFAGLGERYGGKVRDVYSQDDRLIIITSDRVSAFDHVLGTIPFKGELLNRMSKANFEATDDVVPNHVIEIPDPNVVVAKKCLPYPVEFVVRAYVTGSLWRDYLAGAVKAYGLTLPAGMRRDEKFAAPILTPTTKAQYGAHDAPISEQAIVDQSLMTRSQLDEAKHAAFALFERGQSLAARQGLILVDTKYELGLDADGRLTVIDEIHTQDSSRYWLAAEYAKRFAAGEAQAMLDKENLRQWLIDEHGFKGHGEPPPLSNAVRIMLCKRYVEALQRLTGEAFVPRVGPVAARIEANLRKAGLF